LLSVTRDYGSESDVVCNRSRQCRTGIRYLVDVGVLWARTFWQGLFCMIVHGDWQGSCTFGQEIEGLEAAAPT